MAVYILSVSSLPGHCKIGNHVGTITDLKNSYITVIPDSRIDYFIRTRQAPKVVETFTSTYKQSRAVDVNGVVTEWFRMPIETVFHLLIAIIARSNIIIEDDTNVIDFTTINTKLNIPQRTQYSITREPERLINTKECGHQTSEPRTLLNLNIISSKGEEPSSVNRTNDKTLELVLTKISQSSNGVKPNSKRCEDHETILYFLNEVFVAGKYSLPDKIIYIDSEINKPYIPTKALFDEYNNWCELTGNICKISLIGFSRKLYTYPGLVCTERRTVGSGQTRCVYVVSFHETTNLFLCDNEKYTISLLQFMQAKTTT